MLFTGKGDDGSTSFFGCKGRFSKDSPVAEALGTVDELNSFLGIVKVLVQKNKTMLSVEGTEIQIKEVIEQIQQDLFIVQAQLADLDNKGDKSISQKKVRWLEDITNSTERLLPPINSFLVPGATNIGAHLDYARTLARRAERRIIATEKQLSLTNPLKAYINRLSSVLYALARLTSHSQGEEEKPPSYN